MMVSRQIVIIEDSDLKNSIICTKAEVKYGDYAGHFNGKVILISRKDVYKRGKDAKRRFPGEKRHFRPNNDHRHETGYQSGQP